MRAALLAAESGHAEAEGRLTVWSRLATVPWTYLVADPPEAPLRQKETP